MNKAIVFLVAALALPTSVAFAKPSHPAQGGKSAPNVQYVLKGTLSGYTAASGSSDGQITIQVEHANHHARALRNLPLTFTLTAQSRVTFRNGSSLDNGATARGLILVRAPKRLTGDLATMLPASAVRIHVVVLQNTTS